MASPKLPSHKKDIKLICPIRGLGAAMTIHGFETYERELDANGRPAKRRIPNCPVQFFPGSDNIEDGFTVAWVSDTQYNRQLIADLMKAGTVGCDSPIFEAPEVSVVESLPLDPSVGSALEKDRLMGLTKAALVEMAEKAGITVTMDMTKAQIVEALT